MNLMINHCKASQPVAEQQCMLRHCNVWLLIEVEYAHTRSVEERPDETVTVLACEPITRIRMLHIGFGASIKVHKPRCFYAQ
jgi:hypothetical protein